MPGGGCGAEEGRKERPTRSVSGRRAARLGGWLTASALSEARIACFKKSQSIISHPDWVWPLLAPWSLHGTPTSYPPRISNLNANITSYKGMDTVAGRNEEEEGGFSRVPAWHREPVGPHELVSGTRPVITL